MVVDLSSRFVSIVSRRFGEKRTTELTIGMLIISVIFHVFAAALTVLFAHFVRRRFPLRSPACASRPCGE